MTGSIGSGINIKTALLTFFLALSSAAYAEDFWQPKEETETPTYNFYRGDWVWEHTPSGEKRIWKNYPIASTKLNGKITVTRDWNGTTTSVDGFITAKDALKLKEAADVKLREKRNQEVDKFINNLNLEVISWAEEGHGGFQVNITKFHKTQREKIIKHFQDLGYEVTIVEDSEPVSYSMNVYWEPLVETEVEGKKKKVK